MAKCWRCPYTEKVQRKFGVTTVKKLGFLVLIIENTK